MIHFPLILGLPFLHQARVKLDFSAQTFGIHTRHGTKWWPLPSDGEIRDFQMGMSDCLAVSYQEAEMSSLEKEQLKSLLNEFPEVFTGVPGECTLPPIKLELKPGSQPIRKLPYRFSGVRLEQLRAHLDDMLEQGIIEPYHGAYASPVFLVPKPHSDKTRLVVDFRLVNQQIVIQPYPLPTISQQLATLEGKRFFSTLDLCSGYHQLRLDPATSHVTTFTSPKASTMAARFFSFQWTKSWVP